LPVARLTTANVLAPLSAATATAATLSIVDQMPTSLRRNRQPLWLRTGRAADGIARRGS
jgi:hypothetical protein